MKLYYHPISSYSQKALTAIFEKGCPFEPVIVNVFDPAAREAFKANHNRLGKVPFLRDEARDHMIPESSIIIEYLDQHASGPKLIPADPDLARRTRFLDRFFDLYLNDSMAKIFFDGRRPEGKRDPLGVEQARATLDNAYGILDGAMGKKEWALGDAFSMADCAAAPALFYLRMVHPFDKHANIVSYAKRLMERPSYARVVKEVEPHLAALSGK